MVEQWRDERLVREGPIDWGVFKTTLIDRFYTLESREKKLVELMNLCHWGMSVKDYSLNFTQLRKCAPTLVVNSRSSMHKLVMGVSNFFE